MPARHALVVDDDHDCRDGVAQLLEARGYTVWQAEDGRAALDLIAERRPCLVVLDLDLPGVNGWEVLERIRQDIRCDGMAVVIVSGAAWSPADVALVRKPCDAAQLLATIEACTAQGPSSARAADRPGGHTW